MPENWYIGNYRVIETDEIGKLVPCPCDDPVILEFKNGIRDAFHLRELEPTNHPITNTYPARGNLAKNGYKGQTKRSGTANGREDVEDLSVPPCAIEAGVPAGNRERGRLQLHPSFDAPAVAIETSHARKPRNRQTATR